MRASRQHLQILVCLAAGLGLMGRDVSFAQSKALMLTGRVTERSTNQPVSKALVILRDLKTDIRTHHYTSDQGLYAFTSLPAGKYSLTIDAAGFQPEEFYPVVLKTPMEANFALRPAKPAQAPVHCDKPLTESDLITLIKAGVPVARLRQIISSCGIGFRVDGPAEERLRGAGASDSLLDLLRHPPAAPPPS